MNKPASNSPAPVSRLRSLFCLFLLAAIASVVSFQLLKSSRNDEATVASVDRLKLETRDGLLYRPGDSAPFTGLVLDHFKEGTLKLRSAVVDGKLHGESAGWFTNGVRELHEEFQSGLPHGTRTTWHPNGQKRSEGRLVEGKQQGVYRQWDENGKLAAEAEFDNGKPHGISRAWHPDGSLKAEVLMNHGEAQARHVYPEGTRWEPALLAGTPPSHSTDQPQ